MMHLEIKGVDYFVDADWSNASSTVYSLTLDDWDGMSEPELMPGQHQVADFRHCEVEAMKALVRRDFVDFAGCSDAEFETIWAGAQPHATACKED